MKIESITYAGHSAVFIKTDHGSVGLDPWINGNPACPESFQVPSDLFLIVLSHGHADHAGDAAALSKQYGAKIAATYELAMLMVRDGVPENMVIAMNRGGTAVIDGLHISLTTAFHSSSYQCADGSTQYAGEACGIVVSDGAKSIYHAGDTGLFSDMTLIGEQYHPDYALLPIGDHFTMGPDEAAKAAQMVNCKIAIPIHHRTFGLLSGTVEAFTKACASLSIKTVEIEPGKVLQV